MKILTTNHNLSIIFISAIACLTTSLKPAWAENNRAEKPVPEIGWGSRLSSMGLDNDDNVGKEYKFECQAAPEDLIHAPIWGTKVYTVNSGICSTAVHSGMIAPETGGEVTIQLLEGEDFYTGSKKNDIVSKDHRNTDLSFTFVGEKSATERQLRESSQETAPKKRQPSAVERILMNGFQRGVEKSIENTIDNLFN